MKDLTGWSRKRYKLLELPIPPVAKVLAMIPEEREELKKLYLVAYQTIPRMQEVIPPERFFIEDVADSPELLEYSRHYYCDLDSEDILQLRIMGINIP